MANLLRSIPGRAFARFLTLTTSRKQHVSLDVGQISAELGYLQRLSLDPEAFRALFEAAQLFRFVLESAARIRKSCPHLLAFAQSHVRNAAAGPSRQDRIRPAAAGR